MASQAFEFEFKSALKDGELLFESMHGREELGRLPEYRVELLRDKNSSAPVQPKQLLGQSATVKVSTGNNAFRYINGIVTHFEHGGTRGNFHRYRIELRCWLWQLQLVADSKVFQDKTAVEIIDAIFAKYNNKGPVTKKLNATYRQRPYTVQYRETDMEFVSRLMEEEGIYYYFTHEEGKHTLLLCDNPGAHAALPAGDLYWVHQDSSQSEAPSDNSVILMWYLQHRLGSLKFTHTDYAADTPGTKLKGEAQRSLSYPKPNDLEIYDYPGGFEDLAMAGQTDAKQTEGKRLAQLRVNEMESEHVLAAGLTHCRHMAAGFTFDFKGHDDAAGYLITRVDFDLKSGGYEANEDSTEEGCLCRFEAVPKDTKFLPRSVQPRPVVHGAQTAVVVGAEGDEILTDKYGRVKVQFHWDRDGKKNEKSSCWIRVSQPWASKRFGMIALPRVGDEVVVSFLEGNPDRPLITGRVYNGDNMPPYTLPDQATVSGIKTHSSKGGDDSTFNELRFDDKKGSEYIWFQAEKDFHQLVKNDGFVSVKGNQTTVVTKDVNHAYKANYSLAVTTKSIVKLGGDVQTKLGADLLSSVGGAFGLAVTKAIQIKSDDAVKLTASQGLDLGAGQTAKLSGTSGVQIQGATIALSGDTSISLSAGGSSISISSSGVSINGTMVQINSGGGGGSASAAAQASPAAPGDPADPPDNTDPLASGGGSGGG